LILRLKAEKAKRKGIQVYHCFADFQKAFDSIKQDVTWAVFKSYGVGKRLIEVMKNICDQSQSAVKVEGELGDWFRTTRGMRQGDPISPTSFITYLERMMEGMKEENEGG